MTDHPITPPPELIQEWWDGTHGAFYEFETVTTQAARWGADQELEACCEWLNFYAADAEAIDLRAARRPKPQSLAEKALGDFEGIASLLMQNRLPCNTGRIRRALERLQELEGQSDG